MLKEALGKVGIHPRDVAFDIALTKYLNSGGTIAMAQLLLDQAAERMSGSVHSNRAAGGSQTLADRPRQPHEDDEATGRSPLGRVVDASSSSPNRDGRGQIAHAFSHRVDASPVREPSVIDIAGRTAAKQASATAVKSVFDLRKTSDGRAWGNIGAHELDGMERDGSIARIVKAKLGTLSNRQRFMTLRQLMTEATFKQALAQAGVS